MELILSNLFIPYTYILKCPDGRFYYGVRFAQGCNPDEFWNSYFTSSDYVWKLIKEYGKEHADWKWEIRKTFNDSEHARAWEHKVLRRLRVIYRDEFWNKSDAKSIAPMTGVNHPYYNKPGPLAGIPKSAEWSKATSERMTGNNNPMYGKTGEAHHLYNTTASDDTKLLQSESAIKRTQTVEGRAHLEKMWKRKAETPNACKGIPLSAAHKKKISESHKGKILSEDHKKKISESAKGKIYKCMGCDWPPTTPGGLGMHQKKTGHKGRIIIDPK